MGQVKLFSAKLIPFYLCVALAFFRWVDISVDIKNPSQASVSKKSAKQTVHKVSKKETAPKSRHPKASFYRVKRVVDGDTIQLENGQKVRLIGVDTPESKLNKKIYKDAERHHQKVKELLKQGKDATEFTKKMVNGKKVRLEYDVQPLDRYGRQLAYVYLEDGRFVNAELMKAGYAQTLTVPPNVKHQELFSKLQKDARENNRGLWA